MPLPMRPLSCLLAGFLLCAGLGCASRAASAPPLAKVKFTPYLMVDPQLDGMPANRISLPEGWKGLSRLVWSPGAYYMPVHSHMLAEAPDGGSWVEFFGPEMFFWGSRGLDRPPWGCMDRCRAIHHPNITLPEALVRYVIAPNRRYAKNLRILGYRPVQDLPKAFVHLQGFGSMRGNGICMRVSYEVDGTAVDEEFYGFMPPTDAIPAQPSGMEYHSYLYLAHSLGAKAGKLESARPLLGAIATSLEVNQTWQKRFEQIHQAMLQRVAQNLAQGWASIAQAKRMSEQTHASNEAFLQRMEAGRAQSRAQENATRARANAGAGTEAGTANDGFSQYIRGTEHMVDQNGNVSDQYTNYNYHWTDGFGSYVHTNDAGLDPNKYLNGNYQQMTPLR